MLVLDHLAVVAADLQIGSDWLEAQLGVSLQPGGRHDRFGTHNRLLGLADGLYLEVIAPDPNAVPKGPRWFDLDSAPAQPRLGNWICQADDLDSYLDIAGPVVDLQRGALDWRITVPDDGSLPLGGACPTLIKWGAGVVHPSHTFAHSGVRLVGLTVTAPDAAALAARLGPLDARVTLASGPQVRLEAEFDTPSGPRVLS